MANQILDMEHDFEIKDDWWVTDNPGNMAPGSLKYSAGSTPVLELQGAIAAALRT